MTVLSLPHNIRSAVSAELVKESCAVSPISFDLLHQSIGPSSPSIFDVDLTRPLLAFDSFILRVWSSHETTKIVQFRVVRRMAPGSVTDTEKDAKLLCDLTTPTRTSISVSDVATDVVFKIPDRREAPPKCWSISNSRVARSDLPVRQSKCSRVHRI